MNSSRKTPLFCLVKKQCKSCIKAVKYTKRSPFAKVLLKRQIHSANLCDAVYQYSCPTSSNYDTDYSQMIQKKVMVLLEANGNKGTVNK